MTAIPAICKTCAEVFVTEAFVHADPGITFEMRGNAVGPCPRCGGAGRVPDGRYESVEGAVRYLADPTMTIGDLEKLRDIFERAQAENASAAEVADAITKEVPRAAGLGALLQDGATPLATWIAVILAALTLLMQMKSRQPALTPDQVDNLVHRIIEETRNQPGSTEQPPRRSHHRHPHYPAQGAGDRLSRQAGSRSTPGRPSESAPAPPSPSRRMRHDFKKVSGAHW